MTQRVLELAVVPGDGIGPEVVDATLPVLRRAAALEDAEVAVTTLDWGSERYLREGTVMPEDAAESLRGFDAVLFGAVGRPDVPAHVPVWGLILPLRQQLDLYVNLRPVTSWAGIPGPLRDGEGVDFVIVRENTEGEYAGMGGRTHGGTPGEVAVDVALHSRRAIERVARYAFELAGTRNGLVSLVTKSNVSKHGYLLWDEAVADVAAEFADVRLETVFADAMAARMIERPRSLDVVLCSNLFGDILSDLGAPLQGGLGMAPSANLRPSGGAPGIFEPVHGSAPDIVGRGVANPAGCILSAALLLADQGLHEAADAIVGAVASAVADPRNRTPDLGGDAGTADLAAAVAASLEAVHAG
ncbi:MAG TPA: isocitrate/isopropylmalate dehydrogenase family protein [Gaiellaceae bacterium]|nr:isocitrate/isopropylmalate dehydrogenase family protein [Gaiellaceae bacterium]